MPKFLTETASFMLRAFFVLQIFSISISAEELGGKVIGVSDGDTLTILTSSNSRIKIRLAEIDAPELSQPYGAKSKIALSDLVFGEVVIIRDTTIDRYGRTVGRIYTKSIDVSAEMVSQGAAWVYTKYLTDPTLLGLQNEAQQKQLGLWKLENSVPPWDWRSGQRKPVTLIQEANDNACAIKGNINRNGVRIYHIPGSRNYSETKINTDRGERWFCSQREAQEAGWRSPRK